jgi:hypothetical protein
MPFRASVVIPAQAGIQLPYEFSRQASWTPACAGVTAMGAKQ